MKKSSENPEYHNIANPKAVLSLVEELLDFSKAEPMLKELDEIIVQLAESDCGLSNTQAGLISSLKIFYWKLYQEDLAESQKQEKARIIRELHQENQRKEVTNSHYISSEIISNGQMFGQN